MKKEFDFSKVGKKLPYSVPDSYMEEFTKEVVQVNKIRREKHIKNVRFWRMSVAAASVAVVLITGLHFEKQSRVNNNNVDDSALIIKSETLNHQKVVSKNIVEKSSLNGAIELLSDEELSIVSSMLESDIFGEQL